MKFVLSVPSVFPMLLIVTLNAAASTPSRSYENPRLANGEIVVRSACIMPAEGKLSRLSMKGHEGMARESNAWSTELQTIVESHLKLAGVEVVPATGAGDSGASDDELNQLVLKLQGKYDEIAGKIEKKPKDISNKERFTLGDEVALLPCDAKADVLVIVEGKGQVVTGGKKAMGILIGGGPADSMGHLTVTLADAKTGLILAFVRMNNAGKFVNDSEKAYGEALDKQFKKMNLGPNPTAARKK